MKNKNIEKIHNQRKAKDLNPSQGSEAVEQAKVEVVDQSKMAGQNQEVGDA